MEKEIKKRNKIHNNEIHNKFGKQNVFKKNSENQNKKFLISSDINGRETESKYGETVY